MFGGVFAIIPYALFLGVVWLGIRPKSGRTLRLLSMLAPPLLGLLLGIAILISDAPSKTAWDLDGLLLVLAVPVAYACVVGYFYVALIELGLFAGKRLGWIAV